MVSTQTKFFKEIIESGDEQYRNFNAQNVVSQSTDIIGKHIYEFKQISDSKSIENVPEIFVLLISYFEV